MTTSNQKLYEFEVTCPYEKCGRRILFNKNLLNVDTKCPTCGRQVKLCLWDVQPPGMEHITQLKKIALRIWKRKGKKEEDWIDVINRVLKLHRLKLGQKQVYKGYLANP